MIIVKTGTKEAQRINYMFMNPYCNKGSIYKAYGKCSSTKQAAWEAIKTRAEKTEGYNNDIRVVSANCHFFSTLYSYTYDGETYIVYDTKGATKVCMMEDKR